MRALMKMFSRMPIGRRVAAADVPASEAEPQLHPFRSDSQTILAASGAGRHRPNHLHMWVAHFSPHRSLTMIAAHRHDGAGRPLEDAVRDAAEKNVLQRHGSSRAKNHKVCLPLPRPRDDLVFGPPSSYLSGEADSAEHRPNILDERVHGVMCFTEYLEHRFAAYRKRLRCRARLDFYGVENQQRGRMKTRPLSRGARPRHGIAREIDGRENSLKAHGNSTFRQLPVGLADADAHEGDERLATVFAFDFDRFIPRDLRQLEPYPLGCLDNMHHVSVEQI